jgi:hypothetical protein
MENIVKTFFAFADGQEGLFIGEDEAIAAAKDYLKQEKLSWVRLVDIVARKEYAVLKGADFMIPVIDVRVTD